MLDFIRFPSPQPDTLLFIPHPICRAGVVGSHGTLYTPAPGLGGGGADPLHRREAATRRHAPQDSQAHARGSRQV